MRATRKYEPGARSPEDRRTQCVPQLMDTEMPPFLGGSLVAALHLDTLPSAVAPAFTAVPPSSMPCCLAGPAAHPPACGRCETQHSPLSLHVTSRVT